MFIKLLIYGYGVHVSSVATSKRAQPTRPHTIAQYMPAPAHTIRFREHQNRKCCIYEKEEAEMEDRGLSNKPRIAVRPLNSLNNSINQCEHNAWMLIDDDTPEKGPRLQTIWRKWF